MTRRCPTINVRAIALKRDEPLNGIECIAERLGRDSGLYHIQWFCAIPKGGSLPASTYWLISRTARTRHGGSGWNPNSDEDRYFDLPSPSDGASATARFPVLIIKDNESDVFLIQEAMDATRLPLALHIVTEGEEAIRFFDSVDQRPEIHCPALVLLDINLPKKQGDDVLKHVRQSRKWAPALVLVVSTSDAAKDREQMIELGANAYF
jgi:CheY-like chemotaxis protein